MSDPAHAQSPGTMGSFGWMGDVDIQIADAAIADADSASSSAGRSGFTLDLDQARQLLHDATRVRDELNKLQHKADELVNITPPAHDPASTGYHGLLTRQGEQPGAFAYGTAHLHIETQYLDELIGRLRKALEREEETEHGNAEVVKKAGEGGGYAE